MGAQKGGASGDRKGKKPHINKPTSVKHAHYKLSGDKISHKDKTCPRCGAGVFLAQHKDRLHCGKCNYTEFARK